MGITVKLVHFSTYPTYELIVMTLALSILIVRRYQEPILSVLCMCFFGLMVLLFCIVHVSLYDFETPNTFDDAVTWSDTRGLRGTIYTNLGETHKDKNTYDMMIDRLHARERGEGVSIKTTDISGNDLIQVCQRAANKGVKCIVSAYDEPDTEFAIVHAALNGTDYARRKFIGLCLRADQERNVLMSRLSTILKMGGTVRWVKRWLVWTKQTLSPVARCDKTVFRNQLHSA